MVDQWVSAGHTRAIAGRHCAQPAKIYSLYIMYTIAQTVITTGTSLTRYGSARNNRAVLDVAADDDLTFTTQESYHLEVCSQCFTIWTEFISQSVRDEGVTSKLA